MPQKIGLFTCLHLAIDKFGVCDKNDLRKWPTIFNDEGKFLTIIVVYFTI